MTGTAAATTAGRTRPDESTVKMTKRTLHVTPARMTMKTTAVSAEHLRVRRRPGVHRHHERDHYRHHDDDQHLEDRHTRRFEGYVDYRLFGRSGVMAPSDAWRSCSHPGATAVRLCAV